MERAARDALGLGQGVSADQDEHGCMMKKEKRKEVLYMSGEFLDQNRFRSRQHMG
jgi:hypothetical protein